MNYLEAIDILSEIEKKNSVMSIKYKGVSVWPYLRIYLFDSLAAQQAVGYTSSALKVLLSSLFRFNPLRFFKRYRIWNYSSSTTRKKVGNLYEHHVSGCLYKSPYNLLTVEFQSPGIKTINSSEIPEKNIVSGSFSLAITAFFEICMRVFPLTIEREDIMIDILEGLGISFDYKKRIRWLVSQKRTTDFFLTIGYKPELMIMECSYTQMGRIWSAHNHKIPVVELQHGVLNKFHYAYNPTYHSPLLYPDEICVYGEEEYKYFSEIELNFTNKVSMTGLYILDRSSEFFKEDIFENIRKKYNTVVVVSGQKGGEEQLSAFIDSVANKLSDVFFIYIPRHVIELSFKSTNVNLKIGVNIYEYLKWCDYHVTISSTTALEAHYFKKPVIFCDFSGRAYEYYGKILDEVNGAFYVNTEKSFIETVKGLDKHDYTYRELFAHNCEQRMNEVLSRYLEYPQKK